jgi:hypothetical protein
MPAGIHTITEKSESHTIDPKVSLLNQYKKVMEPFEPIQGRIPRKVAISRRKKEYSSFNVD